MCCIMVKVVPSLNAQTSTVNSVSISDLTSKFLLKVTKIKLSCTNLSSVKTGCY